jgi:glutamyl-tRNA reductase
VVDFQVLQRPPGSAQFPDGVPVWRTCLREIAFVDPRRASASAGALTDAAAYAHLLGVICGLDSPIVGETEVMHQFKAFVVSLPAQQGALREMGQRLLTDARAIRARHLVGLGSRSYGSAVRRHVRDVRAVALVGTGMLASDLLPFVADEGRRVDLWGRREQVDLVLPPAVVYRRLADARSAALGDSDTVMVIAAPIPSIEIAWLADRYHRLLRLVDLRAEGVEDPAPQVAELVTLQDVFAEVSRAASRAERRVAAAREEIRQCALAYASREKLRPSGWHDLCA